VSDTIERTAERVAKGAALLDDKKPGWAERIDLGKLQMHSCYECILGQLFAADHLTDAHTPFGVGIRALLLADDDDVPSAYGFDGHDADALNAEWEHVITERRSAP
jgi:hypothetical protein